MAKKIKIGKEKETFIDKNLKKYYSLGIWLLILAVVFVVLYFVFQGLGKVEYEGLTFTKEKYGEIIIYHYYYLYPLDNGQIKKVDILLRGNPAENNVPIDGEIIYPEGKDVYLSINNSGLNECKYSMVALSGFSAFMVNNGIDLNVGTPDMKESQKNNVSYLTCDSFKTRMIISLKAGNESKITKNGLCYNLEVANCEILPVIEKFIVQSIIDAKKAA